MNRNLNTLAVGLGPANLAFAIQMAERNALDEFRIVESRPSFQWHPGMMVPFARLDTHFLKDLVSLRNPRSKYTFVNFLSQHGRVEEFINCGHTSPTRKEFEQYMEWVVRDFSSVTDFGVLAREVTSNEAGFSVELVSASSGEESSVQVRNLVVGSGAAPWMPVSVPEQLRGQIIHASQFMDRIDSVRRGARSVRIAVVGSGQSSAEITLHLLQKYPHDKVTVITRSHSFAAKEGSPFVNEIFSGEAVDAFHQGSIEFRDDFLKRYGNTNLSVVDSGLLTELYRESYAAKYHRGNPLRILNFSEVTGVEENAGAIRLALEPTKHAVLSQHSIELDAAVFATGFQPWSFSTFLSPLEDFIVRDEQRRPLLNRDYSLQLTGVGPGRIFLNGFSCHSHGPSQSVLSVLAQRAFEIAGSISRCTCARKSTASHQPCLIHQK